MNYSILISDNLQLVNWTSNQYISTYSILLINVTLLHLISKSLRVRDDKLKILINIHELDDIPEILQNISYLYQNISSKRLWMPYFILKVNTPSSGKNNRALEEIKAINYSIPLRFDSKIFLLENNNFYGVYSSLQNKGEVRAKMIQRIQEDDLVPTWQHNLWGAGLRGLIKDDQAKESLEEVNGVMRFKVSKIQFHSNIVADLASSLNFTMIPVIGDGDVTTEEDETLVGYEKQLMDGADMSVTFVESTRFRIERGLIFFQPNYLSKMSAFFRQPPSNSVRDVFIQPFHFNVWGSLMSLWLVILLVWILIKRRNEKYGIFEEIDNIWLASVIAQQGWSTSPEDFKLKIVVFTTLLFCTTSFVAYSGAFVSFLSIRNVPIKNYNDIIKSKLTVHADRIFQATHYNAREVAKVKGYPKREEIVMDLHDSIRGFLSKKPIVFLSGADIFYYEPLKFENITIQFACDKIAQIDLEGSPSGLSMFTKSESPYKEVLGEKMITILEKGFNKRYVATYLNSRVPICHSSTSTTFQDSGHRVIAFQMKDLFTAFSMLLVAFLVSSLMLLAERNIDWFTNSKFIEKGCMTC